MQLTEWEVTIGGVLVGFIIPLLFFWANDFSTTALLATVAISAIIFIACFFIVRKYRWAQGLPGREQARLLMEIALVSAAVTFYVGICVTRARWGLYALFFVALGGLAIYRFVTRHERSLLHDLEARRKQTK